MIQQYGFARLDAAGFNTLARWTRGVYVWDIMCGNGALAGALFAQPKAARPLFVESCDSSPSVHVKHAPWREHTTAYVADWRPKSPAAVALLSWPVNWNVPGLTALLRRAARVAYIGSNLGGTACGDAALWRHLCQRPVLDAAPCPGEGTLIVFGAAGIDTPRVNAAELAAAEIRGAVSTWL